MERWKDNNVRAQNANGAQYNTYSTLMGVHSIGIAVVVVVVVVAL